MRDIYKFNDIELLREENVLTSLLPPKFLAMI